MELGDLISLYRKQAGMTIDELSEKSKVPKGTLNKIIGGITKAPTLDNVRAIARALGKTLDDFDDNSNANNKKSSFSVIEKEHQDIIKTYSTLDDHGKRMVRLVLDEEKSRMKNDNVTVLTVPKADPNYLANVSRGDGVVHKPNKEMEKEQLRVHENLLGSKKGDK